MEMIEMKNREVARKNITFNLFVFQQLSLFIIYNFVIK